MRTATPTRQDMEEFLKQLPMRLYTLLAQVKNTEPRLAQSSVLNLELSTGYCAVKIDYQPLLTGHLETIIIYSLGKHVAFGKLNTSDMSCRAVNAAGILLLLKSNKDQLRAQFEDGVHIIRQIQSLL